MGVGVSREKPLVVAPTWNLSALVGGTATPGMPWADLFDRAEAYDVTVDDVRAALADRRAGEDD
jgi:hypothetical protein